MRMNLATGRGNFSCLVPQLTPAVPEPGNWAMMQLGFAAVGAVRHTPAINRSRSSPESNQRKNDRGRSLNMRNTLFAFAISATAIVASPALADPVPPTTGTPAAGIFDVVYSGGTYSGNVQVTTDASGHVTVITGTANGDAITGLSTYAAADNYFYSTPSYVSFNGLSFSTLANTFGIGNTGLGDYGITDILSNPSGACCGTHPLTLSVTRAAVPEPAAWAMMLVGFGGIGLAMRRSRRKSGSITLAQLA